MSYEKLIPRPCGGAEKVRVLDDGEPTPTTPRMSRRIPPPDKNAPAQPPPSLVTVTVADDAA